MNPGFHRQNSEKRKNGDPSGDFGGWGPRGKLIGGNLVGGWSKGSRKNEQGKVPFSMKSAIVRKGEKNGKSHLEGTG